MEKSGKFSIVFFSSKYTKPFLPNCYSYNLTCLVDECGPDGYVTGSRNRKYFHVGGRGMLQVQGVPQTHDSSTTSSMSS